VDGSACGAYGEFYLELFDDLRILGIDDKNKYNQSNTQKPIVYPNPASGQILIRNIPVAEEIAIKITSLDGKELFMQKKYSLHKNDEIKIDLPKEMISGLYILHIHSDHVHHQSAILIKN